jgi:arylsulfatase A-like enzyme
VLHDTLILFLSDNGACPFERSHDLELPPWEGGSDYLYDASWATVGNTPLRHYKQTQHEGGISTPLIVFWKGRLARPGGWERAPGHVIDIMATVVEVGGGTYPESPGIEPLQGKSLLPLLEGRKRIAHDDLYFQFNDCRALRHGDWKVVSFYGHAWELYHIAEDRTEQRDLSVQYPEVVAELSARWHRIARDVDRLPERSRRPVSETPAPHALSTWHDPERYRSWVMPEF